MLNHPPKATKELWSIQVSCSGSQMDVSAAVCSEVAVEAVSGWVECASAWTGVVRVTCDM